MIPRYLLEHKVGKLLLAKEKQHRFQLILGTSNPAATSS